MRRITRALLGAPLRRRVARPTTGGTPASTPVRRAGSLLFGTAALIALAVPAVASADVTAPHDLLTFPQRDFVSASGYDVTHTYTVEVLHPSSLTPVGTVTGVKPVEDAATPGLGVIEVNHPGGACWVGTTPDIRPGDTVRIKDETTGTADTSLVRNVTAQRPVQTAANTVQIHGTAQDTAGNPLPIGELEQRMVAPRDAFLVNGRRTLRATSAAGSDGTLAYDPVGPNNPNGTNWTATYTGLPGADVTRALNAEARIMWLDPAIPSTESTVYENGAGATPGPAAPCTAPLEKLPPPPGTENVPPSTPTGLGATVTNGNTVALSWTASTDNVGVTDYGVYRDGIEIATVQKPDGSAPAPTTFTDRNVPPGTYTYTVDAGDAVGNRSGQSAGQTRTTARPVATLPAGTTVNDPPASPIQIISFPSRDFISSSGFLASDTVQIQVLRREGGQLALISSATQIPQQDPKAAPTDPFAGLVEVNHPGGACWDGSTPDIRAGDIVRTIAYRPDGTIRTVDETSTANAVTERPVVVRDASSSTAADGIIEVHGVAMAPNGDPLPVDQIEQRLVANKDAFDLNGRRTLRAGGAGKDGSLSYDADDPTGTHWTARYTGLDANDISRAIGRAPFPGAESRILWLGSQPLAGLELTIYENDPANIANGPSAPCTAPQEPLDTAPPTFAAAQPLTATQPAGTADVQLTWSPASDDVAVFGYRVYRDGQPLRNAGPDATTFTDHNVAGTHTYQVDAADAASPGVGGNAQGTPWGNRSAKTDPVSITMKDVTAPTIPASLVAKSAADGSVTLTWAASKDDVGVTEYGVYRDGTLVGTAKNADGSAPAPTTFTDTGATAGAHSYTVDAADAAGNRSSQSTAATANVTGTADTVVPTKPATLTVTTPDIHVRTVKLTWPAATDNVGVTGYGVYRRRVDPSVATQPAFAKVGDVGTTTTYTDANLDGGTYDYVVDAVDSAGNRSAKSPSRRIVVANDPPAGAHQLIAFPARDFLSTTGYAPNTKYSFSVLRGTTVFATSTTATSDAAGVIEVNHPGGACWNRITPNIRPGDVVRITGPDGVAEQTTVADITAERPIVTAIDPATGGGTVVVHGTAKIGSKQIPVDQIEQRLVANKDLFDVNGRRTVRAGGAGTDGTLKYDSATSTRWTATYKFSTPDDLARAAGGKSTTGTTFVGAESRLLWLGRAPLAGNEQTIYENGAGVTGGPAAGITGCISGPAQTPVPNAAISPTGLTFGSQAVGTTSVAQTVTLTNTGGAPMHVTRVYIAGLNPADFTVTPAGAATIAAGGSLAVKVSFKPKAAGTRQANVSFADDAANTTDQTVPLVGGP